MNTQGIGLGLVICDNIVTQFDGQIGVKSKYGRGSTFSFSILLGKDDDYKNKMNLGSNLTELKSMLTKGVQESMIVPAKPMDTVVFNSVNYYPKSLKNSDEINSI